MMKNRMLKYAVWLLFVPFLACEDGADVKDNNYQLVWSDEFDVDGAPSSENWTYDIGRGENGWGNQELQSYTDNAENVIVEDGMLKITAIRNGDFFTSARIKTQDLQSWTYGRFEARIKLPYGPGIWPAFWMLGADIDTNPWPQCGEIDIMEFRGQEPNIIHGSVHGPGYSGGNPVTESYGWEFERFDTDFHIYAVEWEEDCIQFYVDDVLYQIVTPDDVSGEWVYDNDFFLLLNVAVGGTFVGFPSVDTPFPQIMYVDYVRVYEAAR